MPDFSLLSDAEVVDFIAKNFHLFASDRSDDFPEKILSGLQRGSVFAVRRKEGFAIAYRGQRNRLKDFPADLIFLFVSPEYTKQGIGGDLVEEVKGLVVPGLPILAQCEGIERRRYFEKHGFAVIDEDRASDTYYLRAPPARAPQE